MYIEGYISISYTYHIIQLLLTLQQSSLVDHCKKKIKPVYNTIHTICDIAIPIQLFNM